MLMFDYSYQIYYRIYVLQESRGKSDFYSGE